MLARLALGAAVPVRPIFGLGLLRGTAAAAAAFHPAPGPRFPERDHGRGGGLARTEPGVKVSYPPLSELPPSALVQGAGRAGTHVRPTLASFSLEGRVVVITGGARGLGLVMGQGVVVSGADLAIVDLNGARVSLPPFYRLPRSHTGEMWLGRLLML